MPMFEVEEGRTEVSSDVWQREADALRLQLLDAQQALRESGDYTLLVLINGLEGAGKGDAINLLEKWMDPRHIETQAFDAPSSEERARPYMWRFWHALPPRGKIGVMFGNWYAWPIEERVGRRMSRAALTARLDEITRFEAFLARERVVLVKLWFHVSEAQQRERFDTLEADPLTRWRVTEADWRHHARYGVRRRIAHEVLEHTGSADAPWIVVPGAWPRLRALTVARAVLAGLARCQTGEAAGEAMARAPAPPPPVAQHPLDAMKPAQGWKKSAYRDELEALQGRFAMLARESAFRRRSLVLVFEGMDAAGKGGAIRRLSAALDVRHHTIVPVSAPNDEERARPWLWRFWSDVPRHGKVTIFDRSWYGRVLVERVEGFADEADWQRAYAEIDDFEATLAAAGVIVLKFWLALDEKEQLKRFRARRKRPHKRFKLTDEDWRNRERWDDYVAAARDMLALTTTPAAPWVAIDGDDKRHARLEILRAVCERLEQELEV